MLSPNGVFAEQKPVVAPYDHDGVVVPAASEAEALAYAKNPIDNLEPLAKAGIPLFLLCGDADDVVPYPENGAIVKQRYEKLGGPVRVLIKKGMGHHPHGLDDPSPIVEFILQHTAATAAGQ